MKKVAVESGTRRVQRKIASIVIFFVVCVTQAQASPSDLDLNFDQYRDKVVLLDFWASWCGPCKESFPWMNRIYKKYKSQGLEIIAVNLDAEKNLATEFLDENPAAFRIFYDPKGKLAQRYQIPAMPTSILFSRGRKKKIEHHGFDREKTDQLESEMKKFLQEERR